MRGRDYVLPQDILDVAVDVLSHRLVLTYDAIADGIPATHAVRRVLQSVPLPQVAPRQRAGGPVDMSPPPGHAAPRPPAPHQQPLVYGQAAPQQPQQPQQPQRPWGERTA
jgi:MoxR-like ATPase